MRETPQEILVFAYGCEPGKGSEPGAGWMWARMLARIADSVTVITRANNAEVIEAALPETPEREGLRFEYVDLPRWARFWKRGPRGIRIYYVLWQFAALRRARKVVKTREFTIAWHLTLANIWLGSLAPFSGGNLHFVFGPVGGGVTTPWRILPSLGTRGVLYEILRWIGRFTGRYLNPLVRTALNRSRLILVQNPETLSWLPSKHRSKAQIFANAIIEDIPGGEGDRTLRSALFAGRLVTWKGTEFALRAVALAEGWRLTLCGEGPDASRLKELASTLQISERVRFLGQLSRDDVVELMRTSEVFLYPSLHDDSPLAVVEAMACGLPVFCLDRGGPPVLIGSSGGRIVPYAPSVQSMSEALAERLSGKMPDRAVVIQRATSFTVPNRARELHALLLERDILPRRNDD